MSFKSDASGFELEVSIANVDDLKLHEETIDPYLEELSKSIEDNGEVYDPVIVDKDTGVVLDGMHRVSAMRNLDYEKIPVCYVDYRDPKVKLGSWCRIFEDVEMKKLKNICEGLGFEFDDCQRESISKILENRKAQLILVSKDECYSLFGVSDSIKEIFEKAIEVEDILRDEDIELRYEPEKDILQKIDEDEVALLIPPASKDEVIEISLSDSVFGHKTTRHVIPARPMRINIPLGLLKEDIQTVEEELTEELEKREVEHLPPGSRFEGREYEEELVIFK